MACSLMGHHAEEQYQCKSSLHHLALYDEATSAVQINDSMEEWFRTVRVKKGCLLSPTLLNILIERIMTDALEEHDGG